jgi:hypothetical protein
MTTNQPHIRTSEMAATLAVDISKAVHGETSATPWTCTSWHATDDRGFGVKAAITDAAWTSGERSTVVITLDNGQEFELEVRPSSPELREAARELEYARQRAERAQDKARNATKEA